jgi:hypothetical protein
MSETEFDLTVFTEEDIARWDSVDLRRWAANLDLYNRKTDVATFRLSSEVIGTAGALTAIDKLVNVLKVAYADREPDVTNAYGSQIEVKVWETDEGLRTSLKYRLRRDLEAKVKEEISNEFGTYATT